MENKQIDSSVRERVVELSREYLKKISADDISRNVDFRIVFGTDGN